jgi:hypothetical protein
MGAVRLRFAWVAMLGALAAASVVPSDRANAAPPNQLITPTVSPTSGDTTTSFGFSVHYVGDYPATSVTAVAGPRTVALSLTSGTATDGIYAGSSTLPAGTWTVTFNAVATERNSPTISGSTVTVSGPAPNPIPSLALPPTAAPTASPKVIAPPPPAPAATPVAVATASVTPIPVAAMPGGSTAEESSGAGVVTNLTPGGADLVPSAFWPVMLGGFGLIGLVIAYSVFAMNRDRRRRALAAEEAIAARSMAMAASTAAEPERTPAMWELDARLEEAPIGTVQYLPLENGRAIGSPPEELSEPGAPRRGNPRAARITEARKQRSVEDRRSLLRRG